jgi:hypothetical protein
VEVEAVGLHGDVAYAPAAQYVAEQHQALHESGADDDAVGVGVDATGAGEVAGESGAQFVAAAGVAVAEGFVRGCGQGPSGGLEPLGTRERGEVRGPGVQVVVEPARSAAAGGGGGAGCFDGAFRDPRAGALAGGEPAFRDEIGVGVGDRVAGDAEVGRESA